jgi:molybdopterin biosynthesis enzyme
LQISIASGGTSAGIGDLVYQVIDKLGTCILVHGVSVKPGKPTIIGVVRGKPFFGLPGTPHQPHDFRHFRETIHKSYGGSPSQGRKRIIDAKTAQKIYPSEEGANISGEHR